MTGTSPYTIEPRNDEYVLTDSADEIIGRFASRDGAIERVKELTGTAAKANKFADDKDEGDRELFELKGVEIFRTGRWKGRKFTARDLDAMVATFGIGAGKAGFRPPVKLGHFNDSGAPAFGWVGGLTRVGSRLVADLIDLPKQMFDAITDHRFDAVSAEIAFDMEVNDKILPVVLLGIALLGSDIPAVAGLKPLRDVAADLSGFVKSEIHVYTMRKSKEYEMDKDILANHPDAITKLEADLTQAKKDGDDDRAAKLELDLAKTRVELSDARTEAAEAERDQAIEDKETAESKGDDGESAVKMARMQAEIDEGKKKFAESEARAKEAEITAKLDRLNIPALRPTLEALYKLAYAARDSGSKVYFSYSEGTGDERKTHSGDVDPVMVLDSHMAIIQSNTAKLFDELGFAGDFGPDEVGESDDPGQKVEDRITAYMADHDKASRADAQAAVFKADPVLKAAYAAT